MKDFLLGFSAQLASLAAKDFWEQIGGVGAILGLLFSLIGFLAWLLKRGQRTTIVELNEKIELLTEDSKNLLSQKKQLTAELVQKTQLITELERDSPSGVRASIARELNENNFSKASQIAKTYVELNSEAMAESYYWLARQKWREVLGFTEVHPKLDADNLGEDENVLIQDRINEVVALAELAALIEPQQTTYSNWLIEIIQINASIKDMQQLVGYVNITLFEEVRILRKIAKTNRYHYRILNELWSSLDEKGHYLAAYIAAQEALFLAQITTGVDNSEVHVIENNVAYALGALGKYDAMKLRLEALLPRQQAFTGINHKETLTTENNLANVFGSLGLYEEQQKLFESLLPRLQKTLGADHPDVLRAENNLAMAYGALGLYEKQKECLELLLPRRIKVLGVNHPKTFRTEINLSTAYAALGLYEEQKRVLEQLLPRQQTILGENHPDVHITENNIACSYLSLSMYDDANSLLSSLLPRRKTVLGENHPFVLNTEFNLAMAHSEKKLPKELKKSIEALIPRMQNAFGINHPDVVNAKKVLSVLK